MYAVGVMVMSIHAHTPGFRFGLVGSREEGTEGTDMSVGGGSNTSAVEGYQCECGGRVPM